MNRGFLSIGLVIAFIAVVLIGGGGYWILSQKPSASPVAGVPVLPNNTTVRTQPTATPPASPKTTTQPTPPTTPTISVPGMSTYTDSDFGFSFWYPSGWTVTAVPASSHQIYAYPGGTVTKQLTVRSNVNPNDVIVIEEFTSPTRTVTIPGGGGGCPGGICPLSVRYYFDADAHIWMQQYPDGSGANPHYIAPGTTQAADVSVNNMGGLHMFYAGRGTATIVPLSARNFLVVTAHGVVGVPQDPLVKTILATDPAVATPVSAAEQVNTIQAEKDAYVR